MARKFNFGFWRDSREIDIVVLDRKLTGIEVKYGKGAQPSKARAGKIKSVITLSKDAFNEDPLMVPASVFLACLEV